MTSVTVVSGVTLKTTERVSPFLALPRDAIERIVVFTGGYFVTMEGVCRYFRNILQDPLTWKSLAGALGRKRYPEDTQWRHLAVPPSPVSKALTFSKGNFSPVQATGLRQVIRHKDMLFTVYEGQERSIQQTQVTHSKNTAVYTLPKSKTTSDVERFAVSDKLIVCDDAPNRSLFSHRRLHNWGRKGNFHIWQKGNPQKPIYSWEDSYTVINELTIREEKLFIGRYSYTSNPYGIEIYDMHKGIQLDPGIAASGFSGTSVLHVECLDSFTFLTLHEDWLQNNAYQSTVRLWDQRQLSKVSATVSLPKDNNCTHLIALGNNVYTASSAYRSSKTHATVLTQTDLRTRKAVKKVTIKADQEMAALALIEGVIYSGSVAGNLRLWDPDLNLWHKEAFPSSNPEVSTCLSYIGGTADSLTIAASSLFPTFPIFPALYPVALISPALRDTSFDRKFMDWRAIGFSSTYLRHFNAKKPLAAASASAATATAAAPATAKNSDQKDSKSKD